jgi:hypothetical protein
VELSIAEVARTDQDHILLEITQELEEELFAWFVIKSSYIEM